MRQRVLQQNTKNTETLRRKQNDKNQFNQDLK